MPDCSSQIFGVVLCFPGVTGCGASQGSYTFNHDAHLNYGYNTKGCCGTLIVAHQGQVF